MIGECGAVGIWRHSKDIIGVGSYLDITGRPVPTASAGDLKPYNGDCTAGACGNGSSVEPADSDNT